MMFATMVFGAGIGFYAEMKYTSSNTDNAQVGGGQLQRGSGLERSKRSAGGISTGEILARDAASLTVRLRDSGSRVVYLTESTQVLKGATTDFQAVRR